jgi:hypothetical protein
MLAVSKITSTPPSKTCLYSSLDFFETSSGVPFVAL